jgi:phosphate transport system permease protein
VSVQAGREPRAISFSALPSDLVRRQTLSWLVQVVSLLMCVMTVAVLLFFLGFLFVRGGSQINIDFFTKLPAPVGAPGGGMLNSLLGTLTLVALAAAMGIPLGVGSGVYLAEYAGTSRFSELIRFLIEALIGVPSIVIGIFAYTVIVLPMGHFSALAGGFALGIIMIPILARTTEDVVHLIPGDRREAGLALGLSRWRVTTFIVLPEAAAGIATGAILAIGRVAGETAPLILTALGSEYLQTNLSEPIDELTLRILKYSRGPYEVWHQQAFAAAFVLVMLVAIGSLALRFATRGRGVQVH